MKKRNHAESTTKAGLILATLAACLSPAFMQTVGAQQAGASSGGLEEVIVTAQRREQNEQEIGRASCRERV